MPKKKHIMYDSNLDALAQYLQERDSKVGTLADRHLLNSPDLVEDNGACTGID
jgi:hypothetical protein